MSLFDRAQDLKEAEKLWIKQKPIDPSTGHIWFDPASFIGKASIQDPDVDNSLQNFVDDLDKRLFPRDYFEWPKAKCECGTEKVHGDVGKEAHSEWCPVRK